MPPDADVTAADDEALLTRLRDLALVDLDALLVGTEGAQYRELLWAYAEDVEDALRTARERAGALLRQVAADPLTLLDAPYATRARDGGRDAADRAARRLQQRALAARALARIDDLAAHLFPRLLEVDRRRASVG
ncbi:MAG: hypothetical protein H6709_02850 [Kofleriaceae bacterium]|nr:hypothetical protein [Kofleriaceae bacterium]MCB9571006.1 hypothetical protein [Kofleriaceae bacterium]